MITHHLIIHVAGRERPLTIHADFHKTNGKNEIEFYAITETLDWLVATVPADIIIKHTES